MKQKAKLAKTKIWVPIVAAAVFALLACLNLRTAIWYDEAYSAYSIRGNFAQIWNMTSIDVHPPFYYFCLKVWSLIFGTSDIALRSMSVFFAAMGIVLAYFLLLFNNSSSIFFLRASFCSSVRSSRVMVSFALESPDFIYL